MLAAHALAGTVVVETQVAASSDDAEQTGTTVHLANVDLALGQRIVGLRFANLAIPPGAPITNAYVEFVAAADDSQSSDLTVEGEASDNASTFVAQDSDISNRPRTAASVAWNGIGIWTTGNVVATPDLATIIQEIVDRPGWSNGNALVLILTGTGRRRAVAYDGTPADAALLHIEYLVPGATITESGGSTDVSEDGPTSDTYTVVLDTTPTADVTITVDPDDQTDVGAGPDTAIVLTFTDADWDQPQTVTVTAVDDAVVEGAHTSTITHAAASADPDYDGIAIADVVANVVDNDSADVIISESGGSTSINEEGPTSDTYTVVLGSQPADYVDVVVDPDGQSDVGAGAGAPVLLTFESGNWDTPRTVTVVAKDDDVVEGLHTSTITHTVFSGDGDYDGIGVSDVVASVTDNDSAGVTIAETGGSTRVREAGPTSDTYTLVLNSRPAADVTVTAQPDAQVDLGAGAGVAVSLVFAPGTWNSPQTVTVTAVDDGDAEGTHISTITHSATSADGDYDGVAIADVSVTVTDNDAASVTVSETGGYTSVAEEGPTSDTYAVMLDMEPTADVIITVDPDDQTDLGAGTGAAITLTFRTFTWDVAQIVTVTAVDDAAAEGTHTSTIVHTASSADPDYDGIAISDVVANVTDNDTAGVQVTESGGSTDVSELGPTSDTYTIVLLKSPGANVTITVTPDGQSDVGAGPGAAIQLTFDDVDWSLPQTVTVTAVDDSVAEGPHTSTITHTAVSADPVYDGVAISDVVANVTDDDTAGVSVTQSGGTTEVDEEGPTSDSYTVVLESDPIAGVSVTVNPDDQTDVGAGPGAAILLSFTNGDWDQPQTVTVTAVDDSVDEDLHTSTITHTVSSGDGNYDGIAVMDVVADVSDNDTAGATMTESDGSTEVSEEGPTSDTYTIVLDTEPTADVTITVTPDDETDLGAGPATPIQFTFTASDWTVPRTVVVTAVDDIDMEGMHTSTITHAANSGDAKYDGLALGDVVADVTDNDFPGITVTESGGSTDVSEAGTTSDSYTIILDSTPSAAVTITVTPDAQTDLGAGPAAPIVLVFTGGDWDVAQPVTVTAVDDAVFEGPHFSTITHSAASTDPNYDGFVIADVVANVTDDDFPGVTIVESGGSTDVSEEGPTSDTYTVVLDSEPTANVSITVDPDGETDLGAGPGTAIVLNFTDADWDQAQTVTVTAVDDAVLEGPHTSTITHTVSSGDANYDGIVVPDVVANVTDNDTPGVTITESAGSTDVNEQGPTSDTYTAVLGTRPTADVTITVDPDDQTDVGAGAGVAIALTFTDADWDQPQTVTVTAVDDPVAEGPHTSTITHTATSGDANYDGIAIADVVANVTDNDTAGVTISESGGSTDVDEQGPTSDTYTVVLDTKPTADVTITVDPDGQTDIGAGAGVAIALTFTDADWDQPQTVTVTAVDDPVAEGPHTSTITHTASSGDANYDGIAIADVVANVTDNDTAGVTISESGGSTDVNEQGPTSDTYTVALDTRPTADVTITVDPDGQTDVGAGAGVAIALTFTDADWDQPQTVTVTAVDDLVAEGPHTSTITHAASSGDANYDGIAIADVVANVTDNDTAGVTISESGGSTDVDEQGPTSDTYTVVLDTRPTADVTITVDPDGETDVGAGAGAAIALTFTNADWDQSQTVTVTAVDDPVVEGAHTSTITHTATSGDANYDGIAVVDVVANVTDNDTASVTITESAGSTDVSEQGPTSDTYAVVLETRPAADVTITVDPDGQSDVGAGAGVAIALTFTDADWDTPQTVTVTAVDDSVAEGPHTSTITHTAASGDADYAGIAVTDVVANVTDNDTAGVTISESGGSTDVSEEGPTSDAYTVVLNTRPTADVTITTDPDGQTDVGAGAGVAAALTFTDADWDQPQTVTVTAVDDPVVEGAHTSAILHAASSGDADYDGLAVVGVAANVTDNDAPQVSVTESGGSTDISEAGTTSDSYALVLNSPPVAPVTVTVTPDAQADVGAGAGISIALTFTNGDWHIVQPVTVTAVDDALCEGPHTSTITHTAASSDPDYDGLAITDVLAQVTDNDTVGVTLAESGASTQVDEAGPTSDTYTLALNSQPTADVAITASCNAQIDLGAGPGQAVEFVFTPGDWDVPHTVVVTAVDDDVIEGVHIVSITHSVAGGDADYSGMAVASVSVTVSDNDPEYVAPPPTDDDIPDAGSEPEEPGDADTTVAGAGAEDENEPDDDEPPPRDDRTIVEDVTTTVSFPGLCGAIGLAALAMCLLGLVGLKRTKCGPDRRRHDPSAVHAARPRHSVRHDEDDTHGDHLVRPRR